MVVGAAQRCFDIPHRMPRGCLISPHYHRLSILCSIVQSITCRSPETGVLSGVSLNSVTLTQTRMVSRFQKELRRAPHVCAYSIFTECSGKEDRVHWQHPPIPQPDQTCDSASAARSAAPTTQLRSKAVLLSTRYNPCDRDYVTQLVYARLACTLLLTVRSMQDTSKQ